MEDGTKDLQTEGRPPPPEPADVRVRCPRCRGILESQSFTERDGHILAVLQRDGARWALQAVTDTDTPFSYGTGYSSGAPTVDPDGFYSLNCRRSHPFVVPGRWLIRQADERLRQGFRDITVPERFTGVR